MLRLRGSVHAVTESVCTSFYHSEGGDIWGPAIGLFDLISNLRDKEFSCELQELDLFFNH